MQQKFRLSIAFCVDVLDNNLDYFKILKNKVKVVVSSMKPLYFYNVNCYSQALQGEQGTLSEGEAP
jgi:hypothetical protein